jgi:adenylate kinase family enzyme
MKIHIVGESGSGKTYLAKALARAIVAPHLEIDRVWVRHGGKELWADSAKRRNPESLSRLTEAIQKDVSDFLEQGAWVVDGNYSMVRDQVYAEADQIVYIKISFLRRLGRVLKRQFIDREWSFRHFPFFFWKFLRSAGKPPHPLIEASSAYPEKLIILHSGGEVEQYLERIKRA